METLEKNNNITVVSTIEESGRTVFKNHDEDLVSKIKAVKLDDDSFSQWRYGKGCVIDKELSETQYLCKSPEGEFFTIDKEDYTSAREKDLLDKINSLYPVGTYWNYNFGLLKNGYERLEVYGSEETVNKCYDALGKVGCKTHRVEVSTWNGISVKADIGGKWSSIMFCWFNTDGNYVNRDYNIDVLRYLKTTPLYGSDLLKEVSDAIPDVKYTYSKDRWFADDFAFTLIDSVDDGLGFRMYKSDKRHTGKYGNRGAKIFSCPKRNTEEHTKADIIERLMPKLTLVMKHLDAK